MEFALFGAHVMELYLKAYLIYKTGKYPLTHEIDRIYEACIEYDDFFKDESLSKHFLSTEKTWASYSHALRYPESLPHQPKPGGIGLIFGVGGTHQTLDCIAHFVRGTVPRPAGHVDVIDELINSDGRRWMMYSPENLPEIRELFLRDNPYFSSSLPFDNQSTK